MNRQCEECGGYELDDGTCEVCGCDFEDESEQSMTDLTKSFSELADRAFELDAKDAKVEWTEKSVPHLDMTLLEGMATAIRTLVAMLELCRKQRSYWMNEFYDKGPQVKSETEHADDELARLATGEM